ncbi:LysR family transcriptional regulator [Mycobacterium sp. MS1601]|uniref:LysR family transcriptional regulator n=1 Tax=Mycobacterium sp. MS1601 TaxID=1936029 RepID=UPI0022B26BB6|nr:LysR family transcriptional regulator [Mycobacterium sp. MS1601]
MLPSMDLRLLTYFVAVAEELHFGRAAARLHIAQPSLSIQIRKLEHSLNAPLFVRTSRHVELTPVGELLLDGSKRLLGEAERLAWQIQDAGRHGSRRPLVVGFQANAAAELTPRILNAFHDLHPDIEVDMRSHDFTDPYVGLADGSVDVAFLRPPVLVQDWLGIETLFVEPRVLVVSATSPLAGLPEISVEQVLGQPFVARRSPDAWRTFWLAADSRHGTPVQLGAEVSTVDECFEAILAERGMAFSQASTQRFYDRPGLAFIPVTDIPPTILTIAWRTDVDSPVTRDFVETAKAVASLSPIPNAWVPNRTSGDQVLPTKHVDQHEVSRLRRVQ